MSMHGWCSGSTSLHDSSLTWDCEVGTPLATTLDPPSLEALTNNLHARYKRDHIYVSQKRCMV